MNYFESPSTDPTFNLALEQYLFNTMPRGQRLFMLWQNRDSVIVGRHQNTAEEIDRTFAEENNIVVVRRRSGGGAVFHDLGNINYTIISDVADPEQMSIRDACRPVLDALNRMGIPAVWQSRNDILVDGKKFSGNAMYFRDGRLMVHGTILFDVDFDKMAKVLRVSEDKYRSKSVKSVRARVANLKEYVPRDMTLDQFRSSLRSHIVQSEETVSFTLTEEDLAGIESIQRARYANWEWNRAHSPRFDVERHRHFPGVGTIHLRLQVEEGRISAFSSEGDYFGNRTGAELGQKLLGIPLNETALHRALAGISLEEYYVGLSEHEFIQLVLG
jgi:lipoate-protein ligase A